MEERKFSLFNTHRWSDPNERPECCDVVPVLMEGRFSTGLIDATLLCLEMDGSKAAPGFMKPEGIVIYHSHSNTLFKKTIEKDEVPKALA